MPKMFLDTESRKDIIKKRILESQKVVVSNMLHEWRDRYGMDYVILVLNNPDEVFSRFRVSTRNRDIMREATKELIKELWGNLGLARIEEFERELHELEKA